MENIVPVKKTTPVDYPILEILKDRWSPRVFAQTPIKEQDAKLLLEAGRWAASCNNAQPWRVIWGIKGTEMYNRIFNCLDDYNKQWCGNSQMLWINAFKKTMGNKEKENFHALHDLGLFMGNVIHQANSMGIAVHQMAGVQFKKAYSEFKFTDDYHVATAVAFGYYGGNAEDLPDDLKKAELQILRKRNQQQDFAFNGNFQNEK